MPLVDVLTRNYNVNRTGVNLSETAFTKQVVNGRVTSNVHVNTFGKLFTRTVDGQLYAQPLIATNVTINGQAESEVVILATTRNIVYAFDAKDPARCDYLWRTRPGQLGTPVPRADYNNVPKFHTVPDSPDFPGRTKSYLDFSDEIGITSTPVIDPAKEFIYVVAKSKDAAGKYSNTLHKLKLETGAGVASILIDGSAPGDGFRPLGLPAGTVPFNQQWQLNRPGLLLVNKTVYIAFGSQGDDGPYHGWVFAVDVEAMRVKAVHCTTPDWGEGGIWQSGGGLAYADGFVYYVAGNGPKVADPIGGLTDIDRKDPVTKKVKPPTDAELSSGPFYGNTIVKLKADTLEVADWFSPHNTQDLNQKDEDLCGGPVLPEGTNMVLGFGKDGFIYACDRDNMGKWDKTTDRNIQSRRITQFHIHGTPLYWEPKRLLYLWSEQDRCLCYQLTPTGVPLNPESYSMFRFNVLPDGVNQMPGGILALSADGDRNGIVWASHPTDKNANNATVAGTLRAFDADNLQNEFWNSDHDPQDVDKVGNLAKFCPPVVANGKVYTATFSNALAVYGLTGGVPQMPLGRWLQADVGTDVMGSASESCDRFTILGAGRDIWDTADAFHYIYQDVAAGTTTLTAQVTSVQNTNPWAKGGLMVRQSLDPGSPHALIALTPSNGVAFQHRDTPGGASLSFNDPTVKTNQAPFVRIVREPAPGPAGRFRFTGFVSTDGVDFRQVGQPVTFAMDDAALAGMAVTSHTVNNPGDPNSLIGTNENGFEELCMVTMEKVVLA